MSKSVKNFSISENKFLNKNVFFSTGQFAKQTGISISSASRRLAALKKADDVMAITRGVWGQKNHPYFNIYGAVPLLLGLERGYVSFLTALHKHDVLSQIPSAVQIATTGHSRKLETPIGYFEFFHLQPQLMQTGIEISEGQLEYPLATAEKALFDTLYISTRKGRRFQKLPELDFENIDQKKLNKLISLTPESVKRLIRKKINFL